MSGPLAGITVLDLSWVLSGPYCTMTLADLGAEVIKVERPPYGDVARTTGPLVDGESGYFFSVNRGKHSISLDLKQDEGKRLFRELVQQVDVLVENYTPGTMDRLGLGYGQLAGLNPRLIYCAISGFGQTGPLKDLPALDVVVQGMGGMLAVTGEPDGPPIKPGTSLGDLAGGLYAAIGVLAAVVERERSGQGQMIDISMLDCQVALLENAFVRYYMTGQPPQKLGTRHPWAVPFQAFPTADGHIVIALAWGVPNQWALLCSALEVVELIDDPRFSEAHARSANHASLEPLLTEAFRRRTTDAWVEALQPFGIPCGPVLDIPAVASLPQLAERAMFVPTPHHTLGTLPLVNTPVKLSRTPGGVHGTSPDMGQDTRRILSERLGLDHSDIDRLIDAGIAWDERPPVELG